MVERQFGICFESLGQAAAEQLARALHAADGRASGVHICNRHGARGIDQDCREYGLAGFESADGRDAEQDENQGKEGDAHGEQATASIELHLARDLPIHPPGRATG